MMHPLSCFIKRLLVYILYGVIVMLAGFLTFCEEAHAVSCNEYNWRTHAEARDAAENLAAMPICIPGVIPGGYACGCGVLEDPANQIVWWGWYMQVCPNPNDPSSCYCTSTLNPFTPFEYCFFCQGSTDPCCSTPNDPCCGSKDPCCGSCDECCRMKNGGQPSPGGGGGNL
jgi:hypothetical protein